MQISGKMDEFCRTGRHGAVIETEHTKQKGKWTKPPFGDSVGARHRTLCSDKEPHYRTSCYFWLHLCSLTSEPLRRRREALKRKHHRAPQKFPCSVGILDERKSATTVNLLCIKFSSDFYYLFICSIHLLRWDPWYLRGCYTYSGILVGKLWKCHVLLTESLRGKYACFFTSVWQRPKAQI